jgi:hypothetical protein
MAAYYKVDVVLNSQAVQVGLPSPQSVQVTLPLVGPQGPVGDVGPAGPEGPQGVPGTGLEVLTTQGDILYQGASVGERLPIGAEGEVLKVESGVPAWGAAGEAYDQSLNTSDNVVFLNIETDQDITVGGDLNINNALNVGSNGIFFAEGGDSNTRDNLGLGTAATSDAGDFAAAVHGHVAADVSDFTTAAAAAAPVQSVNGNTGTVTVAVPSASTATPQALGTAAAGTSNDYARADHVHAKPSAADVGAAAAAHTHDSNDIRLVTDDGLGPVLAAGFTEEAGAVNGIYWPLDIIINGATVYKLNKTYGIFFEGDAWHIFENSPLTANILASSDDDSASAPHLAAWSASVIKARLDHFGETAAQQFQFVGDGLQIGTGSTAAAAGDHSHELDDLSATGITAGKLLAADGAGAAEWVDAPSGGGGGEVRSDFVSPYTYTGLADAGTSESTASWTIRRSEFDAAGTFVATLTASAVEWDDRLTASYA